MLLNIVTTSDNINRIIALRKRNEAKKKKTRILSFAVCKNK